MERPILNLPEYVKIVRAPDGQLVACVEVWDLFDPHTRINTWIKVHPDHQGRGIEAALLRFAEDKARQSAIPRAPAGGAGGAHRLGERAGNGDAMTAYVGAGFKLVRHSYHMQIDLTEAPPAPVWPEGISLRPFVPGHDDAAVAWVDREAFRDHWGFIERPFEADVKMLRHWMKEPITIRRCGMAWPSTGGRRSRVSA